MSFIVYIIVIATIYLFSKKAIILKINKLKALI